MGLAELKANGWAGTGWNAQRAVARASGEWFYPVGTSQAPAAYTVNNQARVVPWVADSSFILAAVSAGITVAGDAGSTVRPIIYADNGGGFPGNLLLDAGPIPSDAIADAVLSGLSFQITAGILYWIGVLNTGVTTTFPTIRCLNVPALPNASRLGTSAPPGTTTGQGYALGASSAPPVWGALSLSNFCPRLAFRTA